MKAIQLEFKFKTKADHLADVIEFLLEFVARCTPTFHKYEKCYGVTLPHVGRKQIEFWFCLPHYSIRPHTHNNENIKLVFLFGNNVRFHRLKKGYLLGDTYLAKWNNIGRTFTINAGDLHHFDVSNFPLVFMNVETWLTEPTSAAHDLQVKI